MQETKKRKKNINQTKKDCVCSERCVFSSLTFHIGRSLERANERAGELMNGVCVSLVSSRAMLIISYTHECAIKPLYESRTNSITKYCYFFLLLRLFWLCALSWNSFIALVVASVAAAAVVVIRFLFFSMVCTKCTMNNFYCSFFFRFFFFAFCYACR